MKNFYQSDKYQNLRQHVKKLIQKSEQGFGYKTEYYLFLGYLIVNNDYSIKHIETIDISIQLLLAEPEKFWLTPSGENSEINSKRDLIKFALLEEFEQSLEQQKNPVKSLVSFIKTQKNKLNKRFENKDLNTILSHNMDFTSPRQNNLNASKIKEYSSLILGMLSAPLGAYLGHLFGVSQLTGNSDLKIPLFGYAKIFNILLFTGAISSSFFTYTFFTMLLAKINNNNPSPWEKINLDEFIENCASYKELEPLINANNPGSIDKIWYRLSHLSHSPHHSQATLRDFIFQELNFLKADMKQKEFHQLLTCLILNSNIPIIKDISYETPIDFLRHPQIKWTNKSNIQNRDYNPLLLHYIKLAITEYLEEELKESSVNYTTHQKNNFTNLLKIQKNGLKKTIFDINKTELPFALHPDTKDLLKFLFSLLIATAGATYLMAYNMGISKENLSENEKFSHGLITTIFGLLSGLFICYLLVTIANDTPKIYENYKDKRNATTMSLLFETTLKKNPNLAEIFKETEIKKFTSF